MRFGEHMSKVKQKSVQELLLALHEQHWASGRWGITAVASVVWLLLLSLSVVSDSLWPHGLYHTRLPCPSLSPGVCSNSCPLSRWCHPTISSSVAHFCSCPQSLPHRDLFQWVGSSHQVAKLLELQLQHQSFWWIFKVISFRIDWFDLAVQGTLKSLLQHYSSKASILQCSAFFMVHILVHNNYGKTIAMTRRIFFGNVMSVLYNMLSRLIITFFLRTKRLLIS